MALYNREYKSSIFAMLFEDRKELLGLYNALSDTQYENYEDITVNTLSDEDGLTSGIFMRIKNDLSFVFQSYLNLYEHQSTRNDNIPLRLLLYTASLLKKMLPLKAMYRENAIKIPTPKFIVFYNGRREMADITELKLSDQFAVADDVPSLELKVIVYNINAERNAELLKKCRRLGEYADFVKRSREALSGKRTPEEKQAALEHVIDECIHDGVLEKFLTKHREEVVMKSYFEYDEKAHAEALWEDGYEDGHHDGISQGISQGKTIGAVIARYEDGMTIADIAKRIGKTQEDVQAILSESGLIS